MKIKVIFTSGVTCITINSGALDAVLIIIVVGIDNIVKFDAGVFKCENDDDETDSVDESKRDGRIVVVDGC